MLPCGWRRSRRGSTHFLRFPALRARALPGVLQPCVSHRPVSTRGCTAHTAVTAFGDLMVDEVLERIGQRDIHGLHGTAPLMLACYQSMASIVNLCHRSARACQRWTRILCFRSLFQCSGRMAVRRTMDLDSDGSSISAVPACRPNRLKGTARGQIRVRGLVDACQRFRRETTHWLVRRRSCTVAWPLTGRVIGAPRSSKFFRHSGSNQMFGSTSSQANSL